MKSMRAHVRGYDVSRWADEFVTCLREECQ